MLRQWSKPKPNLCHRFILSAVFKMFLFSSQHLKIKNYMEKDKSRFLMSLNKMEYLITMGEIPEFLHPLDSIMHAWSNLRHCFPFYLTCLQSNGICNPHANLSPQGIFSYPLILPLLHHRCIHRIENTTDTLKPYPHVHLEDISTMAERQPGVKQRAWAVLKR